MKINLTKNEIAMTKSEYAKAMKVGTVEFEELFRVKTMCPTTKVVIKRPSNKQNYKKLTKEFMFNYVKSNDQDFFEKFKKLFESIGNTFVDENEEIKEISFFYIRRAFLEKYPQFMTKEDRVKYEEEKKSKKSDEPEENTNVVEMPMAG